MPKSQYDINELRNVFKDVLRKISVVEEEQLDTFASLFNLEVFPKKSIIIQPGTLNKKLFFITKGIVRSYYTIDNKEINADFREEKSLFTAIYSVITGVPNIDCYQALEDTVCLVADFNELEALFEKHHNLERLARKIVEKYYTQFLIENYNRLFLSAEERYEIFRKERASLQNRVPLKLIASYLGITPETLSRLRAKN